MPDDDFDPDIQAMIDEAAKDPNEAWKLLVRAAREAKAPVEVVLEFEPPDPRAGRRVRLWYNHETDTEGWNYVDN